MKTLFILNSNDRGSCYGVGTYLRLLTSALIQHNDISVCLVNYLSAEYQELTYKQLHPRLSAIYIPSTKLPVRNEREGKKYIARMLDLTSKYIIKSKNVIFQVNNPTALPLVKQLKSRFPFPVISLVHSTAWQFIFEGNKKKFIEYWEAHSNSNCGQFSQIFDERLLYELSDKIISVTSYMKEFIIKYYNINENKILVVQNGIDSNNLCLASTSTKNRLKKQLGFNLDEKILLFSGRLDPSKGINFLLEAFSHVIKVNNKVRLVLIGDDNGPTKIIQYLSYCKNIWSKVTFTGYIGNELVHKFYQIADIGILPSVYDHCPYTILEMMKYKIPLIVSNIDGLNEILTDKQSIYITTQKDNQGNIYFDTKEIANAIILLLNNPILIEGLIKDYSFLIKSKFSLENMSNEMINILLNMPDMKINN